MTRGHTACPKCQNRFSAREAMATSDVACPLCGTALQFALFPALFRRPEAARLGEHVGAEAQASCFYHETRKAVVPCDQCGRFLCELCDLVLGEQHLCPQCLQSPASAAAAPAGAEVSAARTVLLYDSIALSLALVPLLIMPYVTFLTAPIVIFLVIRYWGRQQSVMPRSRVRFVVAAGFAGIQLVGWATLIGFLAYTLLG